MSVNISNCSGLLVPGNVLEKFNETAQGYPLLKFKVDVFYVSIDKLPKGFDRSDIVPNPDKPENEYYAFLWAIPVDLSLDAIQQADRFYQETFGESFYEVATSPNGIKLRFNNAERARRSPESEGRGQAAKNNARIIKAWEALADKGADDADFIQALRLKGDERKAFLLKWADENGV